MEHGEIGVEELCSHNPARPSDVNQLGRWRGTLMATCDSPTCVESAGRVEARRAEDVWKRRCNQEQAGAVERKEDRSPRYVLSENAKRRRLPQVSQP